MMKCKQTTVFRLRCLLFVKLNSLKYKPVFLDCGSCKEVDDTIYGLGSTKTTPATWRFH